MSIRVSQPRKGDKKKRAQKVKIKKEKKEKQHCPFKCEQLFNKYTS